MRTNVSQEWLQDQKPCIDGFAYWVEQKKPDLFDFTRQCIEDDHCNWANWLMVRCMGRKQYMRYALYSVKQVEPMYRKQHPDSTIVNDVIKAVSACIRDDSKANREAAKVVADAAYDSAGYTAAAAANVAAAGYADAAAANAAYVAVTFNTAYAHTAAYYASFYCGDDYTKVYAKIVRYGTRIMKEKQKCERK